MTIYYRYSRQGKVFSNLLLLAFTVTVTCIFFPATTVLAFTRHLRLRPRTRPFRRVDDEDDGDHVDGKTRLYQQPETGTPEGYPYPRVYNWYKNRTTEQIVPNPLSWTEAATTATMRQLQHEQHRQQSTPPPLPLLPIPAAQETWNWCRYFVVPYNLCPWAAASVQTPGAVSIYLIDSQRDGTDTFVRAVQHVSHLFWTSISNDDRDDDTHRYDDANTAIAFVVDVSQVWRDFHSFYEHYEDLLDDFMESNDRVMLAPFHPEWQYSSDDMNDGNALDMEKRSPHPTISIVAQHVIDQAGLQMTERIAKHNERVFASSDTTASGVDYSTWKRTYRYAIRGQMANDTDDTDHGPTDGQYQSPHGNQP